MIITLKDVARRANAYRNSRCTPVVKGKLLIVKWAAASPKTHYSIYANNVKLSLEL